jgi:hypothetical protein
MCGEIRLLIPARKARLRRIIQKLCLVMGFPLLVINKAEELFCLSNTGLAS